ncbi:hypothetical protein [Cryobacterium sp. Y50]|uniref:hypothetical protein n=1 Tax=Cryobacterium sp. Y50 TaxID=2048286 RepID=UPI000CE3E13C|nr:hypothetical protein [Cryobacterium sp. Y50]
MTTEDTALIVATSAAVIALFATAFSGWQAIIARNSQKTANERCLVEWESASWPEPGIVELRSKGPDDARRVWARITIDGRSVEQGARRIRQGQALRFLYSELAVAWEVDDLLRAGQGGEFNNAMSVSWGAVITWQSRYGRPREERASGILRRRER